MAMDVDEDEEGTWRPKQVPDYGIRVDFESIDEDNWRIWARLLRDLIK
jgi:structural maintenance of chromosome 1